jgi:hypothetical protein
VRAAQLALPLPRGCFPSASPKDCKVKFGAHVARFLQKPTAPVSISREAAGQRTTELSKLRRYPFSAALFASPFKIGLLISAIGLPLELLRFLLGNPGWMRPVIIAYPYLLIGIFFLSLHLSQRLPK